MVEFRPLSPAHSNALRIPLAALQVLGDETLRDIARELVETVRGTVTIDWLLRENAGPPCAGLLSVACARTATGPTNRSRRPELCWSSEAQIIGFLREAEAGLPVKQLCRRHCRGLQQPESLRRIGERRSGRASSRRCSGSLDSDATIWNSGQWRRKMSCNDWSDRRTCRQDDGSILVSFPDVPEALTEGDTKSDALEQAQDCVVAAFGGCVGDRRAIPRPSPARGCPMIALPALVAAKIALYDAMRAEGVGNIALAMRLGLSKGVVRRLIDLDHRSHIGQIETALQALGQQLSVATQVA